MIDSSRFMGIFNPEEHQRLKISVIGLGAIGSGVSELIARIGLNNISLYDNDRIETHNISNQLYNFNDISELKVNSAKIKMTRINETILVNAINERVTKDTLIISDAIFVCTDNMNARKEILEAVRKSQARYLIDGRMGGNVFRVFTVDLTKPEDLEYYSKTLYSDEQSSQEACSARSIIYNIFGVTSIMINQLVKLLKGDPYNQEVIFDYKTLSLIKK